MLVSFLQLLCKNCYNFNQKIPNLYLVITKVATIQLLNNIVNMHAFEMHVCILEVADTDTLDIKLQKLVNAYVL